MGKKRDLRANATDCRTVESWRPRHESNLLGIECSWFGPELRNKKKTEALQISIVSEVYALLSVVALYMRPYRTTHRASVQNHCCPIRIGLTAFNFGNTIARGQNEHGKKKEKRDFLSTLCYIAALPLHFPIRVKLLLLSFLDRFIPPFRLSNFSRMCVLHFCLPSVTRRYSCPFLLPEFHSWVVSLFFFFHHQIKRTQVC